MQKREILDHLDLHVTFRLAAPIDQLEKHESEEAYYEWFESKLDYWFPSNHFDNKDIVTFTLTPPEDDEESEENEEENEKAPKSLLPILVGDEAEQYAKEWRECRNIFAYGTLRHDMDGIGKDEQLGTVVCEAAAPGRMFALPFYPAVVPADDSIVMGQLINFDMLSEDEWWKVLRQYDRYEAVPQGLYVRSLVTALRESDGTEHKAFIYYYANPESLAEVPQVPSGDWREWLGDEKSWEGA